MKPVSENEAFVALIRVAEEDPAVRSKLLDILSLPRTHRRSVLDFYVSDMAPKGAPPEFVSAVACLHEEDVAQRTLALLRSRQENA